MSSKLHVKKGDQVIVIAGNYKDREKVRTVMSVNPSTSRAIVEGVNMIHKHVKPSAKSPEGGIQKMEGTIHISNLMLVDPKSGKPTRIGRREGENGKLVRYSKKSGEVIK